MITFFILVSLLFGFSLLYLWRALKKHWQIQSTRKQFNVDVARQRLDNLHETERDNEKDLVAVTLASDIASPEQKLDKKINNIPTALFISIVMLTSVGVYWQTGNPNSITQYDHASVKKDAEVLTKMESYLADNPNDIKGLSLIANAYFLNGQLNKAKEKYEQIEKIASDKMLVADRIKLAQTYLGLNNTNSHELADRQINYVLNHPDERKTAYKDALYMAAISAIQKTQVKLAIERLNELSTLLTQTPALQQQVDSMIAQLQNQNPQILVNPLAHINVLISDSMQSYINEKQTPESVLYIIARDEKLPFPVGVIRLSLSSLPTKITLTNAATMQSQYPLSSFSKLAVQARISINGQTQKQAGDIQSGIETIDIPTNKQIQLELNEIIK